MIVSTISFWFPLLFALGVGLYWRFTWKDPINHWLICLLVFGMTFLWFGFAFIAVIIALIIKSGVLKSLMNKKDGTGEQ